MLYFGLLPNTFIYIIGDHPPPILRNKIAELGGGAGEWYSLHHQRSKSIKHGMNTSSPFGSAGRQRASLGKMPRNADEV